MRSRAGIVIVVSLAFLAAACSGSPAGTSTGAADVYVTADGGEFALGDLAGQPAVIFFWEPG